MASRIPPPETVLLRLTCESHAREEEPLTAPFVAHLLGQVGPSCDSLEVADVHHCYRSVAFPEAYARPGAGGATRA